MADSRGFQIKTSPATMVELDGDCQRYAIIPGTVEAGAWVPCPDGDHEHRVLSALPTPVAENVVIVSE